VIYTTLFILSKWQCLDDINGCDSRQNDLGWVSWHHRDESRRRCIRVTAFVSRLILSLFSLLAATVLLVHMQPYNDQAVSGLLMSDDCAAPCFMGIQPGITSAGDAVRLLEKHEWVTNIESRYTDFGQSTNTFWGYVYWTWKPTSPLWTHSPTFKLGVHDAYLRILDGRVNEIAFSTSVQLGAAVLDFGQGGDYTLERPDRYGSPPYPVAQHFYYPKIGLVFGSISICPALNPDWHQDTVVTVWSIDYFASFMQVNRIIAPSLKDARIYARMECR
jgi:hypothetical protein